MILFGITFARFNNLLYAPLILGGLFAIWWGFRKRKAIIETLSASQWREKLFVRYSNPKQIAKAILLSLGLIFLFIAFLQPQWGKDEQTVKQEGRDLLIALDVSRSMLAQDLNPNRLEFAKNKIKKILKHLSCERVGLLLFAGSAVVQCPLTADHSAFSLFLNQIDDQTISSGTTIISQAIKKGIEIFKGMPSKKTKLLVLLTDGEDFSPNLHSLKKEAEKEGLAIVTMGIGTPEGAPIPLYDENGNQAGHQKDEHDRIVISQLNEDMLQVLAHDVGGVYVRCQENHKDVRALINFLQNFEKEQHEERKFSSLQERYFYFAAVSLLCFLLEWVL